MASDYATLEEIKNSGELWGVNFADYDAMKALTAASRAVDNYTGRFFDTSVGTRYYTPIDNTYLDIDDLIGAAVVSTDIDGDGSFETTWTLNTDYVTDPLNAAANGWPYERLIAHNHSALRWPCWPRSVSVAGTFGWSTVPEGVFTATMIIATQTVKRIREAPFGIVGFGIDQVAVRISKTDPQITMHLEPYCKGSGVLAA